MSEATLRERLREATTENGGFTGVTVDAAVEVVAQWLRNEAERREFYARYRAGFPRTRAEQRNDIREIQVAAALKLLAQAAITNTIPEASP